MIKYLTHFCIDKKNPFRSLASLPETEAMQIMKSLADESNFGSRFKHPEKYLSDRKKTEIWLKDSFMKKGGSPSDPFPVYCIIGESEWVQKSKPDYIEEQSITIPVAIFSYNDVSFTIPDSMASYRLGIEKPQDLYIEGMHGVLFTLPEMENMLKDVTEIHDNLFGNHPEYIPPYIEAQVWNRELLFEYIQIEIK